MPTEPPSCEREGRARGVRVWQRGRTCVAKRACACGKDGVRVWQRGRACVAKRACVCGKKGVRVWQRGHACGTDGLSLSLSHEDACDVRCAACGVRRAACGVRRAAAR
eukprot:7386884-Prymnesium_polylepis.1